VNGGLGPRCGGVSLTIHPTSSTPLAVPSGNGFGKPGKGVSVVWFRGDGVELPKLHHVRKVCHSYKL